MAELSMQFPDPLKVSIPSLHIGPLAVHKTLNAKTYTVTHRDSGYAMSYLCGQFANYDAAVSAAEKMAAALTSDEWEQVGPNTPNDVRRSHAAKLREALYGAANQN